MIKISIIIPVLNEETFIVKTLNNLQINEAIEVIVVDGGSKDNT
ncbi:MAG: glycosyltransferase, partial [cyanobacterium endosymbiont of Rhopalodia inflata]